MRGSRHVVLRARAAARGANSVTRRSLTSLSKASTVMSSRSSKSSAFNVYALPARTTRLHAASLLQFRAYSRSDEATEVPVPSMGDSISEGTVVEWLKQPGEAVAEDEVVVVLETDKVSVDVRSPFAGTMGTQLANVDDNVTVGSSLFQIVKGAAGAPSAQKIAAPASEETTVPVPSMGDSISEGTVVEWVKQAGDYVKEDEVVVVLETDKVSVDVRAPKSGTITKTLVDVDETVEIGVPLFSIATGGEPPSAASSSAPNSILTPAPSASEAASKSAPAPAPAAPMPVATPAPVVAGATPLLALPERAIRREKMSRMRLRTAERLKESQNTAASLTTFQEVDMSKIMQLRKQYKDAFEAKHGVKLGFMSAFVKASASALLEVPGVNAMIDDEHQEIVYRDYVDMSVAVSTPKGLVTPVLKNTESMSFADVEKGLAELAIRARDGKLTLEEMTGGNFTISNGGVFGSLMGTPIINLPQSGILGMHGTKMRPVVVDGEVVARPMMYLALTYDHRLVDGREGVTCLKAIADKIENPERLLLDI